MGAIKPRHADAMAPPRKEPRQPIAVLLRFAPQILDIDAAAASSERFGRRLGVVDERDDGHELVAGQREGRHAFVRPALSDGRTELVAADVRRQDLSWIG